MESGDSVDKASALFIFIFVNHILVSGHHKFTCLTRFLYSILKMITARQGMH